MTSPARTSRSTPTRSRTPTRAAAAAKPSTCRWPRRRSRSPTTCRASSSLNLPPSTIAKIFSGKITKWNDPAIKADNSGVTLPSTAIQTFHRSDGSGTTYNFTNYLTNVAKSDWTYNFGKTWTAPVARAPRVRPASPQGVKSTAGAIGYFETSYAKQDSLSIAKVGDAGGKFVEDTAANVTAVPRQGHRRRKRQ